MADNLDRDCWPNCSNWQFRGELAKGFGRTLAGVGRDIFGGLF